MTSTRVKVKKCVGVGFILAWMSIASAILSTLTLTIVVGEMWFLSQWARFFQGMNGSKKNRHLNCVNGEKIAFFLHEKWTNCPRPPWLSRRTYRNMSDHRSIRPCARFSAFVNSIIHSFSLPSFDSFIHSKASQLRIPIGLVSERFCCKTQYQ